MDVLIRAWLPLTYAVNCLNRSMGQPDLYPFVIPSMVVEKMAFIHRLIHSPPVMAKEPAMDCVAQP
jgi:hypothetical protein